MVTRPNIRHWAHTVPSRAVPMLRRRSDTGVGVGRGMGLAPLAVTGIKAGVTAVVGVIGSWLQRRKQTALQKEQATAAANEAERHLQDLLNAWNSSDKTRSTQTEALAAFDEIWAWLISEQGCGNFQLGDAGRRCISERAYGGTVPNTDGNWFKWYRDPIANDPDVKPDIQITSSTLPDGTTDGTTASGLMTTEVNGIPVALLAAGALVLVAMMGGEK